MPPLLISFFFFFFEKMKEKRWNSISKITSIIYDLELLRILKNQVNFFKGFT